MSASCRKGSEVGKLAEFEPTKKQRAAIGDFPFTFACKEEVQEGAKTVNMQKKPLGWGTGGSSAADKREKMIAVRTCCKRCAIPLTAESF